MVRRIRRAAEHTTSPLARLSERMTVLTVMTASPCRVPAQERPSQWPALGTRMRRKDRPRVGGKGLL